MQARLQCVWKKWLNIFLEQCDFWRKKPGNLGISVNILSCLWVSDLRSWKSNAAKRRVEEVLDFVHRFLILSSPIVEPDLDLLLGESQSGGQGHPGRMVNVGSSGKDLFKGVFLLRAEVCFDPQTSAASARLILSIHQGWCWCWRWWRRRKQHSRRRCWCERLCKMREESGWSWLEHATIKHWEEGRKEGRVCPSVVDTFQVARYLLHIFTFLTFLAHCLVFLKYADTNAFIIYSLNVIFSLGFRPMFEAT